MNSLQESRAKLPTTMEPLNFAQSNDVIFESRWFFLGDVVSISFCEKRRTKASAAVSCFSPAPTPRTSPDLARSQDNLGDGGPPISSEREVSRVGSQGGGQSGHQNPVSSLLLAGDNNAMLGIRSLHTAPTGQRLRWRLQRTQKSQGFPRR